MKCGDVEDQLLEFVDKEAVAEICQEIEEHLKRCPTCKVHVDTYARTIVLYQESAKGIEIPVRVSQRLREVLAREYERSAGDAHPRTEPPYAC